MEIGILVHPCPHDNDVNITGEYDVLLQIFSRRKDEVCDFEGVQYILISSKGTREPKKINKDKVLEIGNIILNMQSKKVSCTFETKE